MRHDPKTGEPDERLADELFGLIEKDQGYAFISDGIGVLSKTELLRLAQAALTHSEKVCRNLRKFIKTHSGELSI